MRLNRLHRTLSAAAAATTISALGLVWLASADAQAATTGCQVAYSVTSQWQGGFGASVRVTNLGDPLTGWTLTWSFAAGQQVTQSWNTSLTQSGSQVTARNAAWNGALATNASADFGFNGSWTGTNPVPTSFALNGVACTGGTTTPTTGPTPTPTTIPTGGTSPANSMGFIGCSMAENVAQGYVADGGHRAGACSRVVHAGLPHRDRARPRRNSAGEGGSGPTRRRTSE